MTIETFCRFRPPNQHEKRSSGSKCAYVTDEKNQILEMHPSCQQPEEFNLEYVFAEYDELQKDVFEKVVKQRVDDLLSDWRSAVILSYGQTNVGKTYSFEGCWSVGVDIPATSLEDSMGFIPRSVDLLRKTMPGIVLKCSFIEIYNEEYHDLLSDYQTNSVVYSSREAKERSTTNDDIQSQGSAMKRGKSSPPSIENFADNIYKHDAEDPPINGTRSLPPSRLRPPQIYTRRTLSRNPCSVENEIQPQQSIWNTQDTMNHSHREINMSFHETLGPFCVRLHPNIGAYVEGASVRKIRGVADVVQILRHATKNKHTMPNNKILTTLSPSKPAPLSRTALGHTVFTLIVEQRHGERKLAAMHFFDLAEDTGLSSLEWLVKKLAFDREFSLSEFAAKSSSNPSDCHRRNVQCNATPNSETDHTECHAISRLATLLSPALVDADGTRFGISVLTCASPHLSQIRSTTASLRFMQHLKRLRNPEKRWDPDRPFKKKRKHKGLKRSMSTTSEESVMSMEPLEDNPFIGTKQSTLHDTIALYEENFGLIKSSVSKVEPTPCEKIFHPEVFCSSVLKHTSSGKIQNNAANIDIFTPVPEKHVSFGKTSAYSYRVAQKCQRPEIESQNNLETRSENSTAHVQDHIVPAIYETEVINSVSDVADTAAHTAQRHIENGEVELADIPHGVQLYKMTPDALSYCSPELFAIQNTAEILAAAQDNSEDQNRMSPIKALGKLSPLKETRHREAVLDISPLYDDSIWSDHKDVSVMIENSVIYSDAKDSELDEVDDEGETNYQIDTRDNVETNNRIELRDPTGDRVLNRTAEKDQDHSKVSLGLNSSDRKVTRGISFRHKGILTPLLVIEDPLTKSLLTGAHITPLKDDSYDAIDGDIKSSEKKAAVASARRLLKLRERHFSSKKSPSVELKSNFKIVFKSDHKSDVKSILKPNAKYGFKSDAKSGFKSDAKSGFKSEDPKSGFKSDLKSDFALKFKSALESEDSSFLERSSFGNLSTIVPTTGFHQRSSMITGGFSDEKMEQNSEAGDSEASDLGGGAVMPELEEQDLAEDDPANDPLVNPAKHVVINPLQKVNLMFLDQEVTCEDGTLIIAESPDDVAFIHSSAMEESFNLSAGDKTIETIADATLDHQPYENETLEPREDQMSGNVTFAKEHAEDCKLQNQTASVSDRRIPSPEVDFHQGANRPLSFDQDGTPGSSGPATSTDSPLMHVQTFGACRVLADFSSSPVPPILNFHLASEKKQEEDETHLSQRSGLGTPQDVNGAKLPGPFDSMKPSNTATIETDVLRLQELLQQACNLLDEKKVTVSFESRVEAFKRDCTVAIAENFLKKNDSVVKTHQTGEIEPIPKVKTQVTGVAAGMSSSASMFSSFEIKKRVMKSLKGLATPFSARLSNKDASSKNVVSSKEAPSSSRPDTTRRNWLYGSVQRFTAKVSSRRASMKPAGEECNDAKTDDVDVGHQSSYYGSLLFHEMETNNLDHRDNEHLEDIDMEEKVEALDTITETTVEIHDTEIRPTALQLPLIEHEFSLPMNSLPMNSFDFIRCQLCQKLYQQKVVPHVDVAAEYLSYSNAGVFSNGNALDSSRSDRVCHTCKQESGVLAPNGVVVQCKNPGCLKYFMVNRNAENANCNQCGWSPKRKLEGFAAFLPEH